VSSESELTIQLKKGLQFQQEGKLNQALQCYDVVLKAIPHQIDASYFKAIILMQSGELERTIELLTPVIDQSLSPELQPAIARCQRVMGSVYQQQSIFDLAIQSFQKARDLDPEELDYTADLIQALLAAKKLDEARELAHTIPEIANNHLRCVAAQAEVCWQDWRVSDCIGHLQKAMKLAPGQLDLVSQYLLALNYLETDDFEVARQHIGLGSALERHYRQNLPEVCRKTSTEISSKLLRIGFLSPNLKEHSISYFLLPLLKELSQKKDIWVAAYALNSKLDSVSKRIEENCDEFKHLNTSQDLSKIEADDLDILFDLAGHTSGNLLPLLLRSAKPAPVVINWLGYPNTTGFQYHDFRLVDVHSDPLPPAESEPCSEKKQYIDPCFLCYQPPESLPVVNPSPALRNEFMTLGCFNNLNKVTQQMLHIWASILAKDEKLRLLLKSPAFESRNVKQRIHRVFETHSIDPERIQFLTRSSNTFSHLSTYQQVDFTIDTFPYNGTTTTFESILMGCPVITLRGQSHRSRVTSSILATLGFPKWIATSNEEYATKTLELASNTTQLSEIRLTLREKLLKSALCDSKAFADSFIKTCLKCKKPVNSA